MKISQCLRLFNRLNNKGLQMPFYLQCFKLKWKSLHFTLPPCLCLNVTLNGLRSPCYSHTEGFALSITVIFWFVNLWHTVFFSNLFSLIWQVRTGSVLASNFNPLKSCGSYWLMLCCFHKTILSFIYSSHWLNEWMNSCSFIFIKCTVVKVTDKFHCHDRSLLWYSKRTVLKCMLK